MILLSAPVYTTTPSILQLQTMAPRGMKFGSDRLKFSFLPVALLMIES